MSKLIRKLQGKPFGAKGPPPSPSPSTEFLHVPLGSGGTFTNSAMPVGTSACLNTVGVFFEISPSKAFCAHIDASVLRPSTPQHEGGAGRKWFAANYVSAAQIRRNLIQRLDQESETAGWTMGGDRQRMRDTLVVACRRLYAPGTTQVAEVVVKAVMEWVGVAQKDAVVRNGAAFVVQWPQGEVRESDDGVVGIRPVDAEVEEGTWQFQVQEEDVQGVEGSESEW